MKSIRKTIAPISPPCSPQQVYLLGAYNADGTPLLQSQVFVSYIPGPPEGAIIGIVESAAMKGNIMREQAFSLNLCNTDMLPIVESAWRGCAPITSGEGAIGYWNGTKLNVPILDDSPCIEEHKVLQYFQAGDTLIVISEKACIHVDDRYVSPCPESNDLYNWYVNQDARQFNPLLYAVRYYTLGKCIGQLDAKNW